MASLENRDGRGNPVFIGRDVGGWNCDRNRDNRDALIVLNQRAQCVGRPFWGNLREAINAAGSSEDFLKALLTR